MQNKTRSKWDYCLHKLFDHPSLVLIGGRWKTGKTDFALLIAETLLKMPFGQGEGTMITEVASNIDTEGKFQHIYDLMTLKHWLYASKVRKLYIFDEASEHLPSRRSMSNKTVSFIQLIPEVSKAHARMIVIGHQLLTIDKTFLDDVWCRGVFIKVGLKKAQLLSQLLQQPITFRNVPPTTIPFDPYAIAPFRETPQGNLLFKDEDKQLVWRWLNGESYKQLGVHNMKIHRTVQKVLRFYMENDLHITRI